MRKNLKNASTNPEVTEKYVTGRRSKADMTYYSRRAKGPFAKLLANTMRAAVIGFAGYLGIVYAQQQDEVGYVGVIGALANGAALSCGGEYDASRVALL
ncbi:MAG: hypothetical protein EOP36_20765, partial [Rubrivivax sp.]